MGRDLPHDCGRFTERLEKTRQFGYPNRMRPYVKSTYPLIIIRQKKKFQEIGRLPFFLKAKFFLKANDCNYRNIITLNFKNPVEDPATRGTNERL